jgi:hypothetical protein
VNANAENDFEEFILAIDTAMKEGARAEQALRAYVIAAAERIRQQQHNKDVTA